MLNKNMTPKHFIHKNFILNILYFFLILFFVYINYYRIPIYSFMYFILLLIEKIIEICLF